MAKRHKVKKFSFQSFNVAHYRTTEAYARAVERIMDAAMEEIALATHSIKPSSSKVFSFDDHPRAKAQMQKIISELAKNMTSVISSGSRKEWLFACKKNDEFIASILDTSKVSKVRLNKMQDQNLDALKTFQARKVAGMNLSERVWKYTKQFRDQIEVGLDVGLGEGRSAQQLSRDLRQNLQDPNRLFRRVRGKHGSLTLSKAAKAFHPGQGVYRSSYRNAMRLARSEVNMAYRESDHVRWQALDFIVGFEIKRSNREPRYKCKLCDRLAGRYPKTFKFKGWHPQCLCWADPILKSRDDLNRDEAGDLRAALKGERYDKQASKNSVTDFPDNFKDWVSENAPKQAGWASTPYFIKDNFKDGKLSEGLIYAPSNNTAKRIKSLEQIADIQKRWDERNASRLYNLAEEVKLEVQGYAEDIAKMFGAIVTPINLKSKASILRKLRSSEASHNANEIKDAVRTTIISDENAIDEIRDYFRRDRQGGGVVQRIKIQAGDGFLGYTGTIVNIKCSNGILGEVQINTPKMIYAKEIPEDAKRILGIDVWNKIRRETGLEGGLGHKYYEKYRLLSFEEQSSAIGLAIKRASEEYYSHFRE